MRIQDSVWQGYFGYWQNVFIHQNLLQIGYIAWNGFLTIGRGLVICDVDIPSNEPVNWQIDTVPYAAQFIAQPQADAYLQRLELDPAVIFNLTQIIATYDPTQEICILLTGNGQVDVNLLRHLAITPSECYEQVHHRWAEFQPCMMSPKQP